MLSKPILANPELEALLAQAKAAPPMTAKQLQAQKESFVRGMTQGCEHGVLDFEQCPQCRK